MNIDINNSSAARQRIEKIADVNSFIEMDAFLQRNNSVAGFDNVSVPGEGVITGYCSVEGKQISIVSQDVEKLGASFSYGQAQKIIRIMDNAEKNGTPIVFLWDSKGARAQEGSLATLAYSMVMKKMAELSGIVPMISVAEGDMTGNAAVFMPLSDFSIMISNQSSVGIKGATVVASTFGLKPEEQKFNGASKHAEDGNADFVCEDEEEAFETLKRLLFCMPSNNLDEMAYLENEDSVNREVNEFANTFDLVKKSLDGESFLEIKKDFAPETHIGFGSFGGIICGLVINERGQYLTEDVCDKISGFIQLTDAYDIPLVSFVDNNGTEVKNNHRILKKLARLAYSYGEATNPMISVVTGKAIGEGFTAMSNKGNGADVVFAFENAKIGSLDEVAGSIVMYEGVQDKCHAYDENFLSAKSAAGQGVIDAIIAPNELRRVICDSLLMILNKNVTAHSKKHGNMPL